MNTSSVLLDATQDQQLAEHGFVVIPFPTATFAAAPLEVAYGELHGWKGEGFEPDLINPSQVYKAAVRDAIGDQLDRPATDLFSGHRPFLRNFLCKWPGADSDLYLHRDWMYIDERSGASTYVVWIPLIDVDESNGPLQILRGSHRADDRLRGSNLNAPWIAHEGTIRPRLETVNAKLGEAVVLNNALVHCSLPNRSGGPRLVAAVGMRPVDEPLVHFWSDGSGNEARLFEIDEDFFIDQTPQGLMMKPPAGDHVGEADGTQLDLTQEDLASVLDSIGAPHPQSYGTEVEIEIADRQLPDEPEAAPTPSGPSRRPAWLLASAVVLSGVAAAWVLFDRRCRGR